MKTSRFDPLFFEDSNGYLSRSRSIRAHSFYPNREYSAQCQKRKQSFSKRILFSTLTTTDFIEFKTNECVSDDKETINKSIQNRVQLLLLFLDVSKIYSIVSSVKGISQKLSFYGHWWFQIVKCWCWFFSLWLHCSAEEHDLLVFRWQSSGEKCRCLSPLPAG